MYSNRLGANALVIQNELGSEASYEFMKQAIVLNLKSALESVKEQKERLRTKNKARVSDLVAKLNQAESEKQ